MIIITYQDGTVRKITPCDTKSFYSATELPRVKGRSEVLSLESKLQQLPSAIADKSLHNKNVFSIICYRGDKVIYSKTTGYISNSSTKNYVPYLSQFSDKPLTKEDLKVVKKDLRKEHKNKMFNSKSIFTF